jgi:hypothetical protein
MWQGQMLASSNVSAMQNQIEIDHSRRIARRATTAKPCFDGHQRVEQLLR